ncbi:Divergent polysaccharide deacetylase [Enhygromyxa salina]|uniref:Divergent polysaccharide deacetylase n=1 Tax=Enhygromyxa salina TaxID=215803 RepID=A0A2S9XCX4_9BACT|nr:divergent polysaccharide deacetylase family protein [Enhygromyxa salina]PRP90709.1 Divergent polysaccharide deacetylase [Enhygromyxa salina]
MSAESEVNPAPPSPGRRRRPPLAAILLLAWVMIACAAFLLVSPPPEPPAVDPDDQAIRERMANWAVRDAEQWTAREADLTLPWSEADGHLAIVIDDVGRELELFDKLLALRFELSFSVLPNSVFATGVQQRLRSDHRRPREILLHLPMEPLNPEAMTGVEAEEQFLLATDSPEQLRAKVLAALERVPVARGVNNHMGSRLTADPTAMAAIMPVLRQRGLYFLDSRTHPGTVAATEAEAAAVPTISRKVFLDHVSDRAAIRSALAEAADYAREQPTVAIAHPSIELVEILREELPRLHAEGVAIYPLSRLLADQHQPTDP